MSVSHSEALVAAARVIEQFRQEVDARPVMPPRDLGPMRQALQAIDFSSGRDLEQVIALAGRLMTDWNLHTPSPTYFGLYNPDSLPICSAADAMVAAFNPQLSAFGHAPFANDVERLVTGWFLRKFGIDEGLGVFTSGGLEANHSAVICALTRQLPDFAERGVQGSPTLYVSAEAHHSFIKIAHACGLGRATVRVVPVDPDLRMNVHELRQTLASDRSEGKTPFLVVGTAGTTAAGAIDPLPALAEVAQDEDLWFHVDAAWGGAAVLSPSLAPLLDGIALADSITMDAHKWLSTPMGAGMFLCRHPDVLRDAFSVHTTYMPNPEDGPDPYGISLQWSRRFIGLKVFMALLHLGEPGYRELIEHQSRMGHLLARKLTASGWDVVTESPLAVVCFRHASVPAREIVDRVYERRRSWISVTRLSHHGEALRACITNYRTQEAHLDALLDELQLATA